jgi:hypothetical protein
MHGVFVNLHPVGRMIETHDVVDAVLCVEFAWFVTAELLRVGTGQSAGH